MSQTAPSVDTLLVSKISSILWKVSVLMSASKKRWRTLRIASEGRAIAMAVTPVKVAKIKMREKSFIFGADGAILRD
jgi:hypothetical protein